MSLISLPWGQVSSCCQLPHHPFCLQPPSSFIQTEDATHSNLQAPGQFSRQRSSRIYSLSSSEQLCLHVTWASCATEPQNPTFRNHVRFVQNNRWLRCQMSVDGVVQCNQSCVFWWIFRSLFSSKLFRDASPGKKVGVGGPAELQDRGGARKREIHERNGSWF